jgi:hypothetical protein
MVAVDSYCPEARINDARPTMRLLNTGTLKSEDFFEAPSGNYAILSYRWYSLHEEVSYEEYLGESHTHPHPFPGAETQPGGQRS